MTEGTNPRAVIGDNRPPLFDPDVMAKLLARSKELMDVGKAWEDLGKISTEEDAGKLNDFLAQARAQIKEIEAKRKEQKQPHMDAATAVDAAFNPLKTPVENMGKKLAAMQTAYLTEKQRKLDEQRAAERAEAKRKQDEADAAAAKAAEEGDAIAAAQAEQAQKDAAKEVKQTSKPAVARVASGSGGGRTASLRTYHVATLDRALPAIAWFRDNRPEGWAKIEALLVQLAEAERRSVDGVKEIPGVTFTEEKRAV